MYALKYRSLHLLNILFLCFQNAEEQPDQLHWQQHVHGSELSASAVAVRQQDLQHRPRSLLHPTLPVHHVSRSRLHSLLFILHIFAHSWFVYFNPIIPVISQRVSHSVSLKSRNCLCFFIKMSLSCGCVFEGDLLLFLFYIVCAENYRNTCHDVESWQPFTCHITLLLGIRERDAGRRDIWICVWF